MGFIRWFVRCLSLGTATALIIYILYYTTVFYIKYRIIGCCITFDAYGEWVFEIPLLIITVIGLLDTLKEQVKRRGQHRQKQLA